jgi:hypothetical protein
VALALGLLIIYGFGRWWPGCPNFNTDLQRSFTVEQARAVARRCPGATASQVQEALVVDTLFPFCYTIFLAGSLMLLAGLPLLTGWARRVAAGCAWAAIVAGGLDLTLENVSLALVTLIGWPPSSAGATEVLLLIAGVAAWVKAILLGLSALALVVLVLVGAACGVAELARRRRD